MGVKRMMERKSESEVSMELCSSSPPRSPTRQPLYYVQSPSNHDVDKMSSYASSPPPSPHHRYSVSSHIHHSPHSSNSLVNPSSVPWIRLHPHPHLDHDDDDDDLHNSPHNIRLYFCLFLLFIMLFTLFSLILWAVSKTYNPPLIVKNIVLKNVNVQSGNDGSGVSTYMLSLNSTVGIKYRNPASFFGVHVTSTPLLLTYYHLQLASGQIEKFYQSRKSERKLAVMVSGYQVPLYGGGSDFGNANQKNMNSFTLPLNLTFVVRSRAYILGRLVKSTFYTTITCSLTFHGNQLGTSLNLTDSCVFN
ncbi:putative Late embryogenesis abundant protein, LEA-14 [Lupinus albus]|uniref:Putative Late embryogenesis abundant protein, LEA-14 n=1 Tax=Lupinus albus TaxID=3870 RepID=A0A6A4QSM0_LUPAL|nr:putative Late embryogenesis abundant protein, LEA-14 [Lupinus albus]